MKDIAIISLAIVLGSHAIAHAQTLNAVELTPQQANTIKLSTQQAELRETQLVQAFSGTLDTDRRKRFRVAPFVEGMVIELRAVEYQRVKKGDVLARLRSASLGQVQADYVDALARYRLANAERNRLQGLWKDGVIAESRWLQADAEFKSAAAALDQRRRQLMLAGLSNEQIERLESHPDQLAEFELTSPAEGVVLHSEVDTGQTLAAGESAFHVADLSTMWVDVRIPVASLAGIVPGTAATVTVSGRASQPYRGKLQALGAGVDQGTQTITGRVVVDNHDGALRPGLYAKVELQASSARQLMVPTSAVFRSGNQAYVFKATGERRYTPTPVMLSTEVQGWIGIQDGLTAGDEVVSSGVAELKSHWQYQGGE